MVSHHRKVQERLVALYVRGPDLIGPLDGKPLEKIGIHPVLGMAGSGPGRLVDGL